MTANPVRLIIARDLTHASEVVAINLDTKEEVGIDTAEAYNFFPDCIGIDTALAERYSNGQPVAVGMSAADWQAWVEGCKFVEHPGFVWLTLCAEGESDDGIGALCLTDGREAIAPPDEKAAMLADLIGFNAERFDGGYSVVARMSAENWAAWLEMYDAAPLPEDVFDALLERTAGLPRHAQLS